MRLIFLHLTLSKLPLFVGIKENVRLSINVGFSFFQAFFLYPRALLELNVEVFIVYVLDVEVLGVLG